MSQKYCSNPCTVHSKLVPPKNQITMVNHCINTRIIQGISSPRRLHSIRCLFTNAQILKKNDPYATLGLSWGATNTEIKQRYKELVRKHHPDVWSNQALSIEERDGRRAMFQLIQQSYESIMKSSREDSESSLQYSFHVWREADAIAQNRTDVAGQLKKRPQPPLRFSSSSYVLGSPNGSGVRWKRGEYLTDGTVSKPLTSVGTGKSVWIEQPAYKPFKLDPSRFSKHFKI